jgi:ATP-dependent RNA helicase DDX24/MAK5
MQVVEPAADDDDAAEEQELTAEAAATAAAGDEQYDDSADDTTAPAAADADSAAQHAAKGTGKNHKKNQRKKRNKLLKEAAADAAAAAPAAAASVALQRTAQWSLTDEQAASMAQWTYLGVPLHPALLFNLHKLGFTQPTAIQRATLPKAILGRRDIVGAAETGSGKTLAYGLPILSAILHTMDDTVAAAAAATAVAVSDSTDTAVTAAAAAAAQKHPHQLPLQALILCPTRELALQVTLHLTAVSEGTGVSIVSVVGGLAEVKQRRLLKRRPAVVVATPGRLWEMRMSEQHLRDLSGLRYLVIDEADRMTEKGRFDELGKLMRVMTPDSDTAAAAAAAALKAVKGGKRGAKKQPAKGSKKAGKHSSAAKAAAVDESWMQTEQWLIDDSIDATTKEEADDNSGDDSSDDDGHHVTATSPPAQQSTVKAAVARQIFIYSATLSMQSEKKQLGKKGSSKSKSSNNSKDAPEANLERIMEVVGMVNKPSVVDLSQGTATAAVAAVENDDGDAPQDEEQPPPALPENLTLAHVKSLQMEKDAWLYLFCTQYSGRTLVFVNAIVMARRLAEVLKLLRIPCAALHAQMQQRQRLRSLDFLRAEPTAVLIATDVAARGLDVPSVDHVVHYDMPRSAADFVHR